MGEIGSGDGTSYPGALDTDSTQETDGSTYVRANVPNDQNAAIVAIETELGTDPAGTLTDVKTYLQTEHSADGTHGAITPTGITLAGSAWPSFSVHKNGANQASVGSALTLITWPTEEFDTNSDFASNKFTPTVAGKYLLTAALEFEVDADADNIGISIYKNGAAYKTRYESAANTGPRSISISVISSANGTTDYFQVYGANTTTADTVDGTATLSYFQGCRIG